MGAAPGHPAPNHPSPERFRTGPAMQEADMSCRDLIGALQGARRVFIQMHDFPDPDALGSACGMRILLLHHGIGARICHVGAMERISMTELIREYAIDIDIVDSGAPTDMGPEDRILLVDGQKGNANMTDLPGEEAACIDHHPAVADPGYAWKDIRPAGACATLVAGHLLRAGIPLTRPLATLLLYGLATDTANMTRGVTDEDLEIFPLLHRHADHAMMRRMAGKSLESTDLRAFAAAIEGIRILGGTGFALIPFACPDALVAQIADFILSLAEVDAAVVCSARPGGMKFSARSSGDVIHCGDMLADVLKGLGGGGGGHASMAGGFLPDGAVKAAAPDAERFGERMHALLRAWIAAHRTGRP